MSARRPHLTTTLLATVAALAGLAPAGIAAAGDRHDHETPRLEGRAVLPVETYAAGGPAGAALVTGDNGGVINGVHFPTPSQPVEGFSAIVEGRRGGEYLAMPDNGFGTKLNSADFNIRAYYIRPDFKTARGGSGDVEVGSYIEFSDPRGVFGFPIVNEATRGRVLTGADIDPESLQRAPDGTLWVGDEFGPWILHFDARGRLLEAPYDLPDDLWSPSNPGHPQPAPPAVGDAKVNNSRGIEAMAMTPDGRNMYVILEGAVIGDPKGSRRVYEFDVRRGRFTGQLRSYRAELDAAGADAHFIADAQALDRHHLLVIERDGGRGLAATFRTVYEVDLRDAGDDGYLRKSPVLDLTAIPDPAGVSLPALRPTDVGLGDPFRVTCESIEALRILSPHRLLLGCDNNFPNEGRSPKPIADDTELIAVRIP